MADNREVRIPSVLLFLVGVLIPTAALAQTPEQVLLVVNTTSQASQAVADAYIAARKIPELHVVRVKAPVGDEIARADYVRFVETPISQAIARLRAQDRLHYIVLTKDVPLRIAGTVGRAGTTGSVDSELVVLYRKMTGRPAPPDGRIDNPYFLGDRPISAAKPFSHADHDIFLVTRLDGFTADDAVALATRGGTVLSAAGSILLDMKAGVDEIGNKWLDEAATRLGAMGVGDRVRVERTSDVVQDAENVVGYMSWGSSDPAVKARKLGLKFAPGAIAASFVSTDARTMTAPPETWMFGDWNNRPSSYAGSPQSLVGDTIAQGITGVAGNVSEPLLDSVVRPQILFPAWLSGFTLGEAFYLAMPHVGWQGVVFGDPLAVLVPEKRLPAGPEPGMDTATELPAWFAARRLKALEVGEVALAGAQAFLRGESRLARDDSGGGREALEEAVKLAPRSPLIQHRLAAIYESDKRWDDVIVRYRAILDINPRDVIALNNLAYTLAEHKQRPGDALPYAERAQALFPRDASIADTLSWTYHLLGRHKDALKYSDLALSLEPRNGELIVNRAAILLAGGDKAGAKQVLEIALKVDPSLESHARVAAIRAGM